MSTHFVFGRLDTTGIYVCVLVLSLQLWILRYTFDGNRIRRFPNLLTITLIQEVGKRVGRAGWMAGGQMYVKMCVSVYNMDMVLPTIPYKHAYYRKRTTYSHAHPTHARSPTTTSTQVSVRSAINPVDDHTKCLRIIIIQGLV